MPVLLGSMPELLGSHAKMCEVYTMWNLGWLTGPTLAPGRLNKTDHLTIYPETA